LIITPILAIRAGVTGAAWGLAIGYGLESVAVIFYALRVQAYRPATDEQVATTMGARTGGRARR
jgi:Na+-driven multidrug efflux pump